MHPGFMDITYNSFLISISQIEDIIGKLPGYLALSRHFIMLENSSVLQKPIK